MTQPEQNKKTMDSPVLRKQMNQAYKKAFKNAIEEHLKQETPEGVEWLCNLHRELVIRLCTMVKRQDIQDQIAEACDPIIFKQLVEAKKYNAQELSKFVNYIYSWLKRFCAPARDNDVESSLQRLNELLQDSKLKLYTVVAEFITEAHGIMDLMDQDMDHDLVKQFLKTRAKVTLKK